jgi:hypothetical protein
MTNAQQIGCELHFAEVLNHTSLTLKWHGSDILALLSEDSRELQDLPAFILLGRHNNVRSAIHWSDGDAGDHSG